MWPRIWRFAYGLCREPSYADDLAQMTCVRALENAARFESGTHCDRWIFTICRNLWHNELRARKVRNGNGCSDVVDVPLEASEPRAEAQVYARQVVSEVLNLPDAQRETVLLVYIEGYSYKEAAQTLSVPIGTVMSRLSNARKALSSLRVEGA